MAKLNWGKVNSKNLIKRRDTEYFNGNSGVHDKSDFYNPPSVVTKTKASPASLSWNWKTWRKLVQCIHCKNQIKITRLDKHYRDAHPTLLDTRDVSSPASLGIHQSSPESIQTVIDSNPSDFTSVLDLAEELKSFLPNVILKMARYKGVNINSEKDIVPSEIAKLIRDYFKGRA